MIFQKRKKTEQALHISEVNTRAVMEAISDVLIVIDKSGNIIDTNEGHAKRFNLSRKDILGKNLKDFLPKDIMVKRLKNVRKVINTGKPVFGEDTSDGLVTEFSIYPLKINNSISDKVVVFARDITDRKKLLYKIRKTKEQSSLILNTQKVVFYSSGLDKNYSTKWISDKIESLTGFKESDFINDKNFWSSRLHPDDKKQALKTYANVLKYEHCEMEYRWKCSDNNYKWFFEKISLIKDDKGKPSEIIGIWMDITDRKNSEEELRYSEEKYRTLIDTMSEGMLIVDNNDVIQFINRSGCNMYGYELHELIGKKGYKILLHKDYRKTVIKKNEDRLKGITDSYEVKGVKKSGEVIWVKICGTPFRDKSGNVVGSIGILSNITEQKNAVEILKENERKLSTMISNLPGFVYKCSNDKNWTMHYLSDGCKNITGYSPDDFVNNKKLAYNDIIPMGFQPTIWKKWQYAIKHRGIFESEYPIRTAKGKEKWVWERGRGVYSQDNKLLFLEGFITDITDRKLYEDKLKVNLALLRIAGKTAKFGGWSVDLTNKVITWSDEVKLIHETPPEFSPLIEDGIAFYTDEFNDKIREVFTDCAVKGIPYDNEMQIISAKGNTKWVRTTGEPVRDSGGKIIKVHGSFQDITDKKNSDKLIEESEQMLRLLFDNSPNALFLINKKGYFTNANKLAVDRYGYSIEEFKKMTPIDIAAPELKNKVFQHVNNAISKASRFEWKHRSKDNRIFTVEIFTKPIAINKEPFIFVEAKDITERKQMEHNLKESELKFRSFVENANDIVYSLSLDGILKYVSPSWKHLLGHEINEVENHYFGEFVHKDDVNLCLGFMEETKTSGLPRKGVEYRVLHKNGSWRWHKSNATPVKNDDNEVVSFLGIARDITEQKSAEDTLLKSEEKFRKSFLSNPGIVGISTLNKGTFIEINENFCNSLGWTKDEVIGKTSKDLNIFFDYKDRQSMLNILKSEGRIDNFEIKIRTKNGSILDSILSVELIDMNGEKCLLSQILDITERKKNEEILRKKEELYHALFEKNSAVKLLIDPEDGKIFDANSAASEYYGYTLDEIKSLYISNLNTLPPEDIKIEMENALFERRSYFNFKHRLANGNIRDVEVYSSPININDKMLLQSIVHDITDRKLTEELLKKSEEKFRELNASKDKFFNIIAHDLRSPFSSILGFSNLLEEQMKEKNYAGIEDYAGYIQKSAKHAMSLLTNLLDWARSQTGKMEFKPEYIDLINLVDDAFIIASDSAAQKSISLVKDFANNIPVIADKNMVSIILRNIISNAIKFTYTGGKIVVSIIQKPDEVIVSVKDNGVGMSPENLNNLFKIDSNHTTLGTSKEKGTGLGLLLCKEFVEKHEGKIWVESNLGNGSTFCFSLPKN